MKKRGWKRTTNRALSMILSAVMLVSLLPIMAFAKTGDTPIVALTAMDREFIEGDRECIDPEHEIWQYNLEFTDYTVVTNDGESFTGPMWDVLDWLYKKYPYQEFDAFVNWDKTEDPSQGTVGDQFRIVYCLDGFEAEWTLKIVGNPIDEITARNIFRVEGDCYTADGYKDAWGGWHEGEWQKYDFTPRFKVKLLNGEVYEDREGDPWKVVEWVKEHTGLTLNMYWNDDYSQDPPRGDGIGEYICEFRFGPFEDRYMGYVVDPLDQPQFKGHSLLLNGQIGVSFYVDLFMLTEEEKNNAVMEFTVNGKTSTDTFDANCTDTSENGYYGFTCYINSVEMADEITAVLKYRDGETLSQTYSASEYVEYINNHVWDYSKTVIALTNALADYGSYVQPFLAENNHWELGTDHVFMAPHHDYDDALVESAKDEVADKGIVIVDSGSKIENVSYSLSLKSETTINLYFSLEEGYEGTVTASVNGDAVALQELNDGRYRIRIKNIPAHMLGEDYEVVINAGGECTVTVSALSYVQAALTSHSETFNNETAHYAVASIYYYYQAAKNYKENPNG